MARPSMVACVVNTVPVSGASCFTASSPAPHIHSWNCATTRHSPRSAGILAAAAMISPQV